MHTKDKTAIKTLLKIARIWGIFPFQKPSYPFYVYQALMFFTNLLYSTFSIYRNATHFLNMDEPISTFIDLTTALITIFMGLSIQLLSLWNPEKWRDLYKHLGIDSNSNFITSGKRSVYFEIIIVHIFFCLKIMFAIWVWTPLIGLRFTENYCFRHINEYFSVLLTMILVHINRIMKINFSLMNEGLKRSEYVKTYQITYGKLLLLIEKFNRVFGYQILFLMGHSIAIMLESLNYSLLFSDLSKTEDLKVLLFYAFYTAIVIVIKLNL